MANTWSMGLVIVISRYTVAACCSVESLTIAELIVWMVAVNSSLRLSRSE